MQFAILGPVEARADGTALQLGGPKPRALLAMLLLDANEPVSRDRLIEGLWGDDPPPSADQSLDTYISRLRRTLGPDRVVRRPPGYMLVVEPGELDLECFERLVEGRSLHEALGLWRGPALADVLYEPFASEEAERLEERRLVALEERIHADLAAGEGAALVPELEALAREHPYRERLTAQWMLALYRAGRQADALAVMRDARRRLNDELGLAPGPRLRELEQQILDQDPRLDVPAPARAAPRRRRRQRRRAGFVAITLVLAAAAAAAAAAVALLARGDDQVGAAGSTRTDRAVAIDADSGLATASVELPGTATAAVVAAGSLWLADPEDQLVLRVDPDTAQIEDRIAMPGQPGGLTAAGGAVWVAGPLSGTVSRIDPGSGRVTQTVRVGSGNLGAIASLAGQVLVADTASRALVTLDARTGAVTARHTLALHPTALAVAAGDVWVASYEGGVVAQIDPATGRTLRSVRVGGGPSALVVAGGVLWTANALDATVSRIDPLDGVLTGTIAVGSGPAALAAHGRSVWVASQYAGTLASIDTATIRVTHTIRVGGQPEAVAVVGGRVWTATGPSSTAHRGGTLRMVTAQPLKTIDPGLQAAVPALQLARLTHDALVSFQISAGPAGLRLVPDLAVALPRPQRGGREYSFRLRRGIVYSDGRPLRATDFRRGIERLFRIRSFGTGDYDGIVGADRCLAHPRGCRLAGIAADDRAGTVTFRLRAPDPDFPYKLTVVGYGAPVPPGVPDRDAGATVPGTGPYRVAGFAPHRGVRLVRNPHFREWSHAAQPAGNPDVIELRVVDGFDTAAKAVERGDADWLWGAVPPTRIAALRVEHPGQVRENRSFAFEFIPLNTHAPPFDDVRARRALNFAIDRDVIARMYGPPGVATPRCQALLPGLLGHRTYCPYPHDLAKARALVAASGTRGQRVDVWGMTDQPFLPRGLPAYVASVLRSLGYRATLHRQPSSAFTPGFRRGIQLSADGDWLLDYPAPSAYLPQFFGCHGGLTNGYVCDRELDRMMARATALQPRDPRRAAAAWAAADRRITDQALWVSTATLHQPELVSKRLGNYQFHPVWDFIADQAWVR